MNIVSVNAPIKPVLSIFLGLTLLIGTIFIFVPPALAKSCTVPGTHASIQAAIDDVTCDEPITIGAGTFSENLNITRSLTLQGDGKTSTIIDGNSSDRVITIDGTGVTVHLNNMRVTDGDATSAASPRFGGGILVSGQAILHGQNLQVDNNLGTSSAQTGFGGGLAVNNGAAYLTSTMFLTNTASRRADPFTGNGLGGGLYVNNGTLHLVNSQIKGNLANYRAGGITSGGGLYAGSSTQVYLSGNRWENNVARGSNSDPCDSGCANLNNNQGGGAIGVYASTDTAEITITGDTFSSNVDNDVSATTENSGRGGGIFLNASTGVVTATLNNITITQNIAARQSVANEEGQGGAIYARNTVLNIQKARLFDNQAAASGPGSGGGIYVRTLKDEFSMVNTILGGNTASGSGNGAGIHLASNPLGKIRHTTIADDNTNAKQAVYFTSSDVSHRLYLTNTIIASHTVGIDDKTTSTFIVQPINTLFHNVDTTYQGPSNPAHEATDVSGNPRFVHPAQNDYHLRSDSAAIDAGIDAGVTDDIDGDSRPQQSGFDIGADEYKQFKIYLPIVVK